MLRLAIAASLLFLLPAPLTADGKVSKVGKKTINFQIESGAVVTPGDPIEVYFIAPGTNSETVVALGNVSLVLEDTITAQIDSGVEKISVDFGVRVVPQKTHFLQSAESAVDSAQRQLPSYVFRGIEAGTTRKSQLLQDPKWGHPANQSRHSDGSEQLEYQIRGYKRIDIITRNGLVQTIDVTLPASVSPDVAAEAFELGKPVGSELSTAALVGTSVADSWSPIRYSAGRVLLFSEEHNGSREVRLLRAYAPTVIRTDEAKPFVPKVEYTLNGQDDTSRKIVTSVIKLIEDLHFSSPTIDDEIAKLWLDNYIDKLDPAKLYLLQSDVDRFRQTVSEIDDKARLGDIGFAYRVFETYVERFRAGQSIARQHLAATHDFSLDEEVQITGPLFPENTLELREIWRRRIKYEILLRKSKGADHQEALVRVARHLDDQIRMPGHVNDATILDWCVTALVNALDPHSDFYSPQELEDFRINQEMQMVGIGARLRVEDGYLLVMKIVEGSPSHKDGRLAAGDRILGVGQGTSGQVQSLINMRLADSVRLIRGTAGTIVRLKVQPKGATESRFYDLKRERFVLQNRIRSTILTQPRREGSTPMRIGVIVVPSFYDSANSESAPSSIRDTRRALDEFRRENVDVVVLDFRSNGGGGLTEAVNYPGLFLRPGSVVQTKDKSGQIRRYQSEGVSRIWTGPMVVMTNRFTSTGAEIFVGAMRDYRRALIVGDSTTNANGSVQNLYDIGQHLQPGENPPGLGSLRLTNMMFYRVSGDSVQLRGIAPDIVLPSAWDTASYGEAALAHPLPFDRIAPVTVPADYLTESEIVEELNAASQQRRTSSPEFQDYANRIRQTIERASRTSTTLNETRFLADYGQLAVPSPESSSTIIERDAFFNEVLQISAAWAEQHEWLQHHAAGMQKLSRGEYAAALSDFETALKISPERTSLRLARAKARAGAGDWAAALREFKAVDRNAIPARVTKEAQLKVQSEVLRELKPGDRVFVTNTNDTWVWAEFASDREIKGWVRNGVVAPSAND